MSIADIVGDKAEKKGTGDKTYWLKRWQKSFWCSEWLLIFRRRNNGPFFLFLLPELGCLFIS